MNKVITVKGIGKISAHPDYVIIGMELESRNKKYDKAMELAAANIMSLTDALVSAGFKKEDLKTTDYNVRTEYDNIRRKNGSYEREFQGYAVTHNLKVEFDFENKRLSKALEVIGNCLANPQISIAFTIKDTSAINEEMLRTATVNARCKAEILCEASGKRLGDLLSIDYNWGEMRLYSDTSYDIEERCLAASGGTAINAMEIEPDDIDVSDTVTFVWEIV